MAFALAYSKFLDWPIDLDTVPVLLRLSSKFSE
jgi:hypothetical protein